MSISNKGDITTFGFDEDALFSFSEGDDIRNFGRLETFGDLANGIFAFDDAVTILNFGEIRTEGAGAGAILAVGSELRVSNHGNILTTGNPFDPNGIPFDFDESFADGVTVVGNLNRVDNYGDIRADGFAASAIATVGDNNKITNHGSVSGAGGFGGVLLAIGSGNTITNRGLVAAEGQLNPGLIVIGTDSLAINSGTIQVLAGAYSEGMRAIGENNSLINQGAISVSGDDYAAGMLLAGGMGQTAANHGTVIMSNNYGFGMGAAGPDGSGFALTLRNDGSIVTSGDHGIGILSGTPRFDDIPNPPHGGRLWAQTIEGLIENNGLIRTTGDGAAGIVMYSVGGEVRNSGRIETWGGESDIGPMGPLSASGIVAVGPDVMVTNSRTGSIIAHDQESPAVQLNVMNGVTYDAADYSTLLNRGTITAPSLAVVGGDASETVLNYGRIFGNVELGDGADTYVAGKGGSLAGVLKLGLGGDTVVLEDGSGLTTIGDFQAGSGSEDALDLSAFGFRNLASVVAAARQVGSDLVVNLDRNDQLVLQNTTAGELYANDFIFDTSSGGGGSHHLAAYPQASLIVLGSAAVDSHYLGGWAFLG